MEVNRLSLILGDINPAEESNESAIELVSSIIQKKKEEESKCTLI